MARRARRAFLNGRRVGRLRASRGRAKQLRQANQVVCGHGEVLRGHVDSIARGIAVADAQPTPQGLAMVNPVFTWVRLAQRIPVRVSIRDLPPEVILVVGMTASIDVGPESEQRSGLGGRLLEWMRDNM